MTVNWDGQGAHSKKFGGPFSEVTVAADQAAVFLDAGAIIGTLGPGVHTQATVPFMGTLSAAAELHLVLKAPGSAKFGSAHAPLPPGGPVEGTLRHFGEWRYQVINPERFAHSTADGDPIAAASRRVGDLFNACALEWMSGGHMQVFELAANHEKFRQVLPAHIEPALEAWGLMLVELGDFQAVLDPT